MKERFENTLPYIIAIIIFYNFTPVLCALVNAPGEIYNALPALDSCFAMIVSFFFAKRYGGDWLIALEAAVVFVPCMRIFFNATAWIYILLIALLCFIAIIIGTVFRNRIR